MTPTDIRNKYINELTANGWKTIVHGPPQYGIDMESFLSPAINGHQLTIYINKNENGTVTVGMSVLDCSKGRILSKPDFVAFSDGSKSIAEVLEPGFRKFDKWCRQKIESLQKEAILVKTIVSLGNSYELK